MASHQVIVSEPYPVPMILKPSNSFIQNKLHESKGKVGKFILLNLLVCPFFCAIVVFSIWGEAKVDASTFLANACSFPTTTPVNGYVTLAFLVLWVVYHTMDIRLLLAVATDNLIYCRKYNSFFAPLIWALTILSFGELMWLGLNPWDNNKMTQFIIIFGSSTILVWKFFGYYLNALSDHISYLTIYLMLNDHSIEYL